MSTILLALVAAHAQVATADTWPSWRGDGAQTGRSPSTLGELAVRWTYAAGDAVVASAVVDAERVYVGSKDGTLHAVSRATGAMRWTVRTGGGIEAPALLAGGLVIVGSRDGKLRAFEPVTGALRWQYDAGAEIVGAASFVPATGGRPASVLIGDYAGDMAMIELASGKERWVYPTGAYIYGSAAVVGERAVFGGCDGFVHTITLDGKAVSKVPVEAYVGSSVAVDGNMGWTGHFGNRVIGFDVVSGAVAWSHFDRSFPYLSSPAVTSQVVILGGRDHVVRALERKTGAVWWMFPVPEKVDSSPVVVGDRVVVGASDGRLYVLDVEDGSEKASYDLAGAVTASPAVAGGWVFVGTEEGTLYGLGPGPVGEPRKKGRP